MTFSAIAIFLALCFSGVIQALASSNPPVAAQPPSVQPPTTKESKTTKATFPQVFTNILYDDDGGHNWGWDPNNSANTFLINDTRIVGLSSTVVVNTHQPPKSFVICVPDFLIDKHFEVTCNKAPREGAQLRYTIINVEPLLPPTPSVSKEIEERYENVSEGIEMGPLPSYAKKTSQLGLPILSQN
jgi:hypothetical protein